MDRCGIYIDIEGTKSMYRNDEYAFYKSLDCLLSTVFKITRFSLPHGNEFFIHPMGVDGIFLVSRYSFTSYEVPINISVFLLQNLLFEGAIGKCGVSIGNNFDIQSFLNNFKVVIEELNIDRTNLFYTKIMGTALLNSYSLTGSPSGGLLVIDNSLIEQIPDNIVTRTTKNYLFVDWIHTESKYLDDLYKYLKKTKPSVNELKIQLQLYINKNINNLSENWINNTILYNGCDYDEILYKNVGQ